jgi:hypothetical protein
MNQQPRILYCHCAYAQVLPKDVKEEVLRQLTASGVAFDAVPDLCEMSARQDPSLKQLAATADGEDAGGGVKIAACYPRAVKWLFAAAGTPLPENGVEIVNMRVEPAEKVVAAVLGDRLAAAVAEREGGL